VVSFLKSKIGEMTNAMNKRNDITENNIFILKKVFRQLQLIFIAFKKSMIFH
jgi:hypothetical protein